jgi:hypothetical protein
MADDPIEEIQDNEATDLNEASSEIQPEDIAPEPAEASPVFNKRSASRTIKVGS